MAIVAFFSACLMTLGWALDEPILGLFAMMDGGAVSRTYLGCLTFRWWQQQILQIG